ncbi:MAG: restriction endonuclease subunit S [Candidatus Brocadiales bacterium]|nr:restriction endonuclease subunit S [Candidatus Brocadiales bacterium]
MSSLKSYALIDKKGIQPKLYSNDSFYYYSLPGFDERRKPSTILGKNVDSNKFEVNSGTILISKLNPRIRRVWKVLNDEKYKSISSTEFVVLKPHSCNYDFLFYFLQTDYVYSQLESVAIGSTNSHVRFKPEFIYEIKAKFPSQITQRKIARILSTVAAVIEKTGAAIAKYKAIKQGMLHDLFTRGIDMSSACPPERRGKLRPTYEDAPELYKESTLGWIPKEWEENPLELLSTQIGDGIHATPRYSENTDFYFVNGNNLSEGQIQIGDTALCISEEEYKIHFKELNERTILYSINGTIGNIAFYKSEKIILGKSACYISCNRNVNLDFIYFFLQSFQVNKFYENELTGSTIKNLSLASVKNTPITIPKDDKEQELIANRIRTITNKIQTEQTYLHKLHQIKAGLMADLLSGKKKVNVEEELTN